MNNKEKQVKEKMEFIEKHLKKALKPFLGKRIKIHTIHKTVTKCLNDIVSKSKHNEIDFAIEQDMSKGPGYFYIVPKNKFTLDLINHRYDFLYNKIKEE